MLELDHLPFSVVDVDPACALFRRIGFEPSATGVCRWSQHGQAYSERCASTVFESGYLDLIEVRDGAWERRLRASPLHHQGLAPSGVVLGTPSLDAARARLAASGIAVGEAYEIVRELPGAEPASIRYELLRLDDSVLPLAVIRDFAPRAMRRDAWLRHPNTASGVRCIHVRVPSLDAWHWTRVGRSADRPTGRRAASRLERKPRRMPAGRVGTEHARAELRSTPSALRRTRGVARSRVR